MSLKFIAVLLAMLLPCSLVFFPTSIRSQNTITVMSLSDPASMSGNGFCTLREAIDNANSPGTDTSGGDCAAGTGDDIINFSVSGTIRLGVNGTLPAIVNTLTIDGTGQSITVDGATMYQVLWVDLGATLNLQFLTLEDGNVTAVTGAGYGGAIVNNGTLNVPRLACPFIGTTP